MCVEVEGIGTDRKMTMESKQCNVPRLEVGPLPRLRLFPPSTVKFQAAKDHLVCYLSHLVRWPFPVTYRDRRREK